MLPVEHNSLLDIFYDPDRNIDNFLLEICNKNNIKIHNCKNNKEISTLLLDKQYDVFYSALPYLYTDIIVPKKTKFIYTIHGLRDLEYPFDKYEVKYKHINLKIFTKYLFLLIFPFFWKKNRIKTRINNYNNLFSLTSNKTIITVSNHSKYSILYFFPKLRETEIKTLYSPAKKNINSQINDTNILESLSLIARKYILLICGDRSEKGAYIACNVLYKLIKQKKIAEDIRVLVLGVSYNKHYKKLTKNNNRFVFYNYVSYEDLEVIYKNAHLFLYPTLNEGFGYPPLEAMKYGTLCACSANSAVTEVCKDAVLYFNPFDNIEMSIRILQSFDENIRTEKKEKMAIHYQLISKKQKNDLDSLIQTIIS